MWGCRSTERNGFNGKLSLVSGRSGSHRRHRCVGESLAEVETEGLFSKRVERVATISSNGPAVLRLNNTIRRVERLPLLLLA